MVLQLAAPLNTHRVVQRGARGRFYGRAEANDAFLYGCASLDCASGSGGGRLDMKDSPHRGGFVYVKMLQRIDVAAVNMREFPLTV